MSLGNINADNQHRGVGYIGGRVGTNAMESKISRRVNVREVNKCM